MKNDSLLILGIDPVVSSIPSIYQTKASPVISWAEDVMEECLPYISGVKFQSAYFESLGIAGLSALSTLTKRAKEKGLVVIMDAKRGDIGSTSLAYATAYLAKKSATHNGDFESDFLTVNPLMGDDCLQPFIDVAIANEKGIFVLLETSNPGAEMILKETVSNGSVSEKIAAFIQKQHDNLNLNHGSMGPIGCVIGATNSNVQHWREKLPNSIFLMPGIGAQGGDWETVKSCLNHDRKGVLVPISRGITSTNDHNVSARQYQDIVKKNIITYFNQMESIL